MRLGVLLSLLSLPAAAEIRVMTLGQALETALKQNPDLALARLDQQRLREEITIAKDPFAPKVVGFSGLAKGSGFPLSVENSAPSIIRTDLRMALFNRPLSYQVAQANEAARSAELNLGARQDEVAYRVAALFLDAERAGRSLTTAERQIQSLVRVADLIGIRVSEGRDLPIENRRAALAVLKARQSIDDLTTDMIEAETRLAMALGLDADDRVRPAQEDRPAVELPASEERAIEDALDRSRELKRLESDLQIKQLEAKRHKAERLPKINAIASYALLARYNNYDRFFSAFQRNNWQLGGSFEFQIIPGRAATAAASQAEIDAAKIRVEVSRTRNRIRSDLRLGYQRLRRTEGARDVARAELDLAREELTVRLAQYDEGRLPLARVEEARAAEQEKWLAYYSAQHGLERARLEVLRQSGTLLAALR
jgi:outer membrane protein TolC